MSHLLLRPCLFVCSNGNQVQIFAPIAKALEQFEIRSIFLGLDHFYHHGVREKVLARRGDYRELSISQSVSDWWKLSEQEQQTLLMLADPAINEFMRNEIPAVVIFGNDYGGLEQLMLRSAERFGALTVRMQDGIQLGAPVLPHQSMVPANIGDGGCDVNFCWGESLAKNLHKRGVPGRTIISGNPAHDDLAGHTTYHRHSPPYRVFVAAQNWAGFNIHSESQELELYENICRLILRRPDTTVILKPHPSSAIKQVYATKLAILGERVTVDIATPSLELLRSGQIDLVVTISSTVGFESALLGIPTVRLSYQRDKCSGEYKLNEQKFADFLFDSAFPLGPPLGHNGLQSLVAEHSLPVDGRASARVAQGIFDELTLRSLRKSSAINPTAVVTFVDTQDASGQLACIARAGTGTQQLIFVSKNVNPTIVQGADQGIESTVVRSFAEAIEQARANNKKYLLFSHPEFRLLHGAIDNLTEALDAYPQAVAALGWTAARDNCGTVRSFFPIPSHISLSNLSAAPGISISFHVCALRIEALKHVALPNDEDLLQFVVKLVALSMGDLNDTSKIIGIPKLVSLAAYPRQQSAASPNISAERPTTSSEGPEISVILSSYNRVEKVKRCLEALCNQTLAKNHFEVICVNDGSTDATGDAMKEFLTRLQGRYCEHETNRALAAGRNTGIRAARGRLLVFINDDTYAEPNFLEEHLAAHRSLGTAKAAVLGFLPFSAEHAQRVFSHALMQHNLYFGYQRLECNTALPFWNFITGNLSIPRVAFLETQEWFDEDFQCYGFEDIECGYRLSRHGYQVYFWPQAVMQHDHRITIDSYMERERQNAQNILRFVAKHPDPGVSGTLLHAHFLCEAVINQWKEFTGTLKEKVPELLEQIRGVQDVLVSGSDNQRSMVAIEDLVREIASATELAGTYARLDSFLQMLSADPALQEFLLGEQWKAAYDRQCREYGIEPPNDPILSL